MVVDRLVGRSQEAGDADPHRRLGGDGAEAGRPAWCWSPSIDGEELLFSEHFACVHCGISLGEIAPRTFSFNSPHGACPACTGLGVKLEIDPDLVIPNKDLSLAEGAIQPWSRDSAMSTWYDDHAGGGGPASTASPLALPVQEPARRSSSNVILYGNEERVSTVREPLPARAGDYYNGFEGVIPNLERRYRETESEYIRSEIERYMAAKPCPACQGKRLKPEALAVTIGGRNIIDVTLDAGRRRRWTGCDDAAMTRRPSRRSPSASARSPTRSSRRSAPAWASWRTSGWTT